MKTRKVIFNEVSILNQQRYEARRRYIELNETFLEQLQESFFFESFLELHWNEFSHLQHDSSIKNLEKEVVRELDVWCYHYKTIMNEISINNLEELSQWDDTTDQTFMNVKIQI